MPCASALAAGSRAFRRDEISGSEAPAECCDREASLSARAACKFDSSGSLRCSSRVVRLIRVVRAVFSYWPSIDVSIFSG
jgi:hypothetical protein